MMDDTSDISRVEQSAVSVRLVYKGEVEEHMLALIDSSEDQTADGLTRVLLNTLSEYGITPDSSKNKLIGQSYDGAPTMSGELRGVQKQVQNVFPFAYYNHCIAHRLALCASQSSSKVPKIAKFFSTVDKLIDFFRSSPKRTSHLGRNLPKPGDTRWFSRDTAIGVLDAWYENIGTVLFEIANDNSEKSETQITARGLCIQVQQVEFIFFLKFYRKLFEYFTPVTTMMQKTSIDAVQISSMLEDLKAMLTAFDFGKIWEDTLADDPVMPTVRVRTGWRGIEDEIDGSHESWRRSVTAVAKELIRLVLENVEWRFANLKKFKWMKLVDPSKFSKQTRLPQKEQRALIEELNKIYQFLVPDVIALENSLDVLYNNREIILLLERLVRERDSIIGKKRGRNQMRTEPRHQLENQREEHDPELMDRFAVSEQTIFADAVQEGKPNVQDLLLVIRQAELEDALPQVVKLLELAVVTPLTSVHCERIFSKMKGIISPARSKMLQKRKEMLVFLQVEQKILKWLSGQKYFKDNVVARFKGYNQSRFERFSRK